MTLEAGTRVGPYQVLGALGAGGMGEVYRARDLKLSREVALKVLPETLASNRERLARFQREAQTLASFNHPNIATIHSLEESDRGPCLVLELVEGETLATRLMLQPLPVRDALAIAAQVANALEVAHAHGIVHRDLKPGNVMLTPGGAVKVLDFGLAKLEPNKTPSSGSAPTVTRADAGMATELGVVVGTAAYMSPEQVRGAAVDRRSDIWSFGCMLYECLTGRPAFRGAGLAELFAHILERDPDWAALPAGLPSRAREALRRCLRRDPEARPRDIRDVRLELQADDTGADDRGRSERSVAVLPFENLSGPDDEYFADGITDEILNALAQVDGLRVAARTSCFAFKGRKEDLRSIGERLDVKTVLEGSVRRAGERLRITTQLVNAADGYQLWSERYDRQLTDVFEVQEAIALEIASRLRGDISQQTAKARVRRSTNSLEAYELLLRGRALQNKRGRFIPQAIECFEKVLALDPECAQAMAWLADTFRLLGVFGHAPSIEVMPRAKQLAQRAVEIDPGLAEALSTMACVVEQYELDFKEGDRLWERALSADPHDAHARAQRSLWGYLRGVFNEEQTHSNSLRALADDPLNPWVGAMHSFLLGFIGRHAESIAAAEQAVELDAESFFPRWNVVRGYAWAGNYARALELAPALLRESGRDHWTLGILAWVYGRLGDRARAHGVFSEMEGRSRHEFFAPFWLASAAASVGLEREALAFAERCVTERDPLILQGRISPVWDGVRALPGFEERVGKAWS